LRSANCIEAGASISGSQAGVSAGEAWKMSLATWPRAVEDQGQGCGSSADLPFISLQRPKNLVLNNRNRFAILSGANPSSKTSIHPPMKTVVLAIIVAFWSITAIAGPFNAREAFGVAPGLDLNSALKRAEKDKKRVFLIFWNSREKGNYPGLEMKYFAELQETKKLLKDNFIVVLLDRDNKDAKKYRPEGNIEKAQWVLIAPDGSVVKQAAVYGNPDEGLKAVKELVALP
jgi:hypothetical protein